MQATAYLNKPMSSQKIQTESPKKKISTNSREENKYKHRTEHKTIDSLEAYQKTLRKNQNTSPNDPEFVSQSQQKSIKPQQTTGKMTDKSKYLTELSTINDSILDKHKIQSGNEDSNQKGSKSQLHQMSIINRQKLTSRFTINDHDAEDQSLTILINQAKSKDSNPLINTARLKQQNRSLKNPLASSPDNQESKHSVSNNFGSVFSQLTINKESSQDPADANNYQHSRITSQQLQNVNIKYPNENFEGQNFDEYLFGGMNSNGFSEVQSCQKQENSQIIEPPRAKPYTLDKLSRKKPENWRQLNRYIPQTEEEHRMNQQIILNHKISLQAKRQKQQIITLIQQYQLNKNSIHALSQRKIETNRIIQKIYRDKRIVSEGKHTLSLPHLKHFPDPKNSFIIPGVDPNNPKMVGEEISLKMASSKTINIQNAKVSNRIKGSLSYGKLGFGSSQPRLINSQQLNDSELENVYKIQKKLRQKGISFNTSSIRKGFLNIHDTPIFKISTKNSFQRPQDPEQRKIDLPSKQLPSNDFYKIFPL